ncbi:hypothetical protein C9415_25600 [Kluyvera sp. Nf5]|nr:hypothetical protein C9415_25600 [Kluyvera sp. Nf5]
MSKKLLEKKGVFFGYCLGMYFILSVLISLIASPIFSNSLAESLPPVLLAYWMAKMLSRFFSVRSMATPFLFFIVQVMAFIGAGAVTHQMTGTDYAMWVMVPTY